MNRSSHLIRSEASYIIFKIKQKLSTNTRTPKGATQQLQCLDKEQLIIKWFQTIYSVKWTFTHEQIPRQNEKFDLLSANKVSVSHMQTI